MAKRSGAGSLNRRITFQRRGDVVDEFGVVSIGVGPWENVYTCAARLMPYMSRKDSETVIADRLASMSIYYLTVRSCAQSRAIKTDWRAVDTRVEQDVSGASPRAFNIKTIINPDERGQFLEMLVVEGESS